jgi:hypothetical protein
MLYDYMQSVSLGSNYSLNTVLLNANQGQLFTLSRIRILTLLFYESRADPGLQHWYTDPILILSDALCLE